MNRRGFLGALAAALVLDPERALWVPGKKVVSIPSVITPDTPWVIFREEITLAEFRERYIFPALISWEEQKIAILR